MAVYTTIDNPELYFQVKAYTGTDASPQAFTLDGDENMQPDLVWIKNRGYANKNVLFDSVRGVNKSLTSDSTAAEVDQNSDGGYVSAFGSDGFTLTEGSSSDNDTNDDRYTYVAWCWKESATAGFDIVIRTGNGSAGTVSHNLSAVPRFIMTKCRSAVEQWIVQHGSLGATKHLILDSTAAESTAGNRWNDTTPTTSVYSIGTDADVNGNTETFVDYVFAEKQGFSKFGSYTGNGNANGTFIYTGFRPAWVMIKSSSSTESWVIFDNKREGYNPQNDFLRADTTGVEANTTADIDLLSNGFKNTSAGSGHDNDSGQTYIYAAFAEAPFVNSNGVPCNAR